MSEKKPFPIQIDGRNVQLEIDNCGVALFREEPDADYLDYWEPSKEDEASNEHWWTFNPYIAHWIGGIALSLVDQRDLRIAERQHGTFREQTGWNPPVIIEDTLTSEERYQYALHKWKKLNSTKGEPEDSNE